MVRTSRLKVHSYDWILEPSLTFPSTGYSLNKSSIILEVIHHSSNRNPKEEATFGHYDSQYLLVITLHLQVTNH